MFEVDFHILNQKASPAIYADTLALRPSPGFVGRLFVATDSPYGVFRDTGTAWVQVASNGGGGGGSTGVNGLNGTTNIGLGGTLNSFTQILGGNNDILFRSNNNFTIDRCNNIDIKTITSSGVSGGRLNLTLLKSELFFGDSLDNTIINLTGARIKTTRGGGEQGLDLLYGNQIYTLGDYGFTAKKNSIRIDDSNSKIYLTTGKSASNTDPDLFLAQNVSTTNRLVKLGDISGSYGGITLEVNDSFGNPSLTTTFGNLYYGFQVLPTTIDIGDYNGENSYTNLKVASSLSKIYTQFKDNNTLTQIDTGLYLDNSINEHKFGVFNYSIGDNYLFINDRDIEFFCKRDFKLTGSNIEDPTPGTIPVKALFIVVNGTKYKLNLY